MQAEERMWPRWVPLFAAAFSLFVAAIAPFAHHEGPVNPAVVALLFLATVPSLIEATGRMLPPPLFALGVYVPIAVVNLAGGAFGMAMAHDGQLSFMLLTLAAGQLASRTDLRQSAWYSGVAVVMPFGRYLVEPHFVEWVFWSAGISLGVMAGLLMQRQHALYIQLQAAQAKLADEAARQERRRIAREVHDVIAHSLTVSMLHLTAARMAVRRNPEDAEEALADAERLGRQALNDVRRTVGLLHGGDESATAAALPGAAEIPELVEAYRSAGLDIRFDCSADLTLPTPAGGLALYRAVQEGLANAAKHAPGAAVHVAVSMADDRLMAKVSNDLVTNPKPATGQGMGLRGMRERIEALGGSVAAGPSGDGWVTSCAIPVQPAQ